jgi:iron transport multicopper oxidase
MEIIILIMSLSAFFNNITYVSQKVPTLYTALSTGEDAVNPLVYGEFAHPFVLGNDQVIDIVVNNMGTYLFPISLLCRT